MGRAELAANDFRITQTEDRLRKEGTMGQTNAMDVHHEVGKKVRKAIEDIGGTMPEDLAGVFNKAIAECKTPDAEEIAFPG